MENPRDLLEHIASVLPEVKSIACDQDGSVWVFTEHPNTLEYNGGHERYMDVDENYIGEILIVSPILAQKLRWNTEDWTKRVVSL